MKFGFRAIFVAVLLAGVVLGGVGSSAEVAASRVLVNLGGVCVREGARDRVAGKRVVCVSNVKKQLRWRLVKAKTVRVVTVTTTSTSVVSTTVAPTTTSSTSTSTTSTSTSSTTTSSSSTTSTTSTTLGGDRTAPVVTLGRSTGSSGVATLTFTVTGNEPIVCSTLSGSEGVDFRFTRISRINSIVQTAEDVCTISVQSTAEPGDTNPRESSLAAASTFSITDRVSNAQTVLSGSPQTIWVQRIARPVIALSATTETANVNAAMNGYTVNSSGGTVASYSLTGTLPAGVSFSTTTGRITGTPTATQTATTYTITATNISGSGTATFTLTVVRTCANGGECVVGNTGPGGGIVFYVSAANFTSTGSDCDTTCKYLEAATSDQGAFEINWCSNTTSLLGVTATGIGSGMSNTTTADLTCTSGRIQISADYTNNGKTDWYLPSKDELNQMCKWQRGLEWVSNATRCSGGTRNTGPGASGFVDEDYWSSTELNATDAWYQAFADGSQSSTTKGWRPKARPVRAFGPTG